MTYLTWLDFSHSSTNEAWFLWLLSLSKGDLEKVFNKPLSFISRRWGIYFDDDVFATKVPKRCCLLE